MGVICGLECLLRYTALSRAGEDGGSLDPQHHRAHSGCKILLSSSYKDASVPGNGPTIWRDDTTSQPLGHTYAGRPSGLDREGC